MASNAIAVHVMLQGPGMDTAFAAALTGADPAAGPLIVVIGDFRARRASQGAVSKSIERINLNAVER